MSETITQIGRYEISRQLVDTALASVYDAFDPVERKSVAIRVPRTTGTHGIGALSAGLKHPGLMTVLTYEENQGETFLVLEPFEGKPLEHYLPAGQKMEPGEALGLLRQLASTLDYAHGHGYIHGSLHPSSILLNDRRQIKVLDLGPTDPVGPATSAERLLRAVPFLSPECLRDRPMDGRSDQFSLAVLAHQLLTGELPFAGTPLGIMFRIGFQGLERDAIRNLPPAAQTVFQRSLAKSPAERYSSCTQMVDALEDALIQRPVAATRIADASEFAAYTPALTAPPKPSAAGRHFSREALKYFVATFAVCALILAGLFYFLMPKRSGNNGTVVPGITPLVAAQPVVTPPPAPAEPAATPPREAARKVARPAPKTHGKKKTEPEVELKPVEPKIIRP